MNLGPLDLQSDMLLTTLRSPNILRPENAQLYRGHVTRNFDKFVFGVCGS